MVNIILPGTETERRLVFYLAMEEYVAAHLDEILGDRDSREAFFHWQVSPTVIFGRNQVMEAEVNIAYCKEQGIKLFRRKSGGGCVYSDRGNIMLSFISSNTDVESTFWHFLGQVVTQLRSIGLNVERSGRNDILLDGRKISGNAFFLLPKSSIVHGTMLFDSDFSALERAITPSKAKISSKGVESMRQHVTNLRPVLLASEDEKVRELADIELYKAWLTDAFCKGESIVLSDEQVAEIEKIEASYLEPDFISGKKHDYKLSREGKCKAGLVKLELEMDGGVIRSCMLSGDYFSLKDGLCEKLDALLRGAEDNKEALRERLGGLDLSEYVRDLWLDDLLDALYPGQADAHYPRKTDALYPGQAGAIYPART